MIYQFTPEQEAWLVDLETTEEPQTKGFLHVLPGISRSQFQTGYCCLGRACVVMGIEEEPVSEELGYFLGESVGLPRSITKLLHLRGDCGEFKELVDEKGYTNLADMNDDGWTFKEIAAYIRANPENVFLPNEEDK